MQTRHMKHLSTETRRQHYWHMAAQLQALAKSGYGIRMFLTAALYERLAANIDALPHPLDLPGSVGK